MRFIAKPTLKSKYFTQKFKRKKTLNLQFFFCKWLNKNPKLTLHYFEKRDERSQYFFDNKILSTCNRCCSAFLFSGFFSNTCEGSSYFSDFVTPESPWLWKNFHRRKYINYRSPRRSVAIPWFFNSDVKSGWLKDFYPLIRILYGVMVKSQSPGGSESVNLTLNSRVTVDLNFGHEFVDL